MKHIRAIETKTGADCKFPAGAERARWRPGNSYPDGEVEPFAPLDHFRISQQVLAPAGPRTDSRLERLSRPLPEETLFWEIAHLYPEFGFGSKGGTDGLNLL